MSQHCLCLVKVPPASSTLLAKAWRSMCGCTGPLQSGSARQRSQQFGHRSWSHRRTQRFPEQVRQHELAGRGG